MPDTYPCALFSRISSATRSASTAAVTGGSKCVSEPQPMRKGRTSPLDTCMGKCGLQHRCTCSATASAQSHQLPRQGSHCVQLKQLRACMERMWSAREGLEPLPDSLHRDLRTGEKRRTIYRTSAGRPTSIRTVKKTSLTVRAATPCCRRRPGTAPAEGGRGRGDAGKAINQAQG